MRARLVEVFAAWILLGGVAALAESGPQPTVTIDLKPLGMAADLFAKPPDNRDQSRGLMDLFWLDSDRLVAAFSTSPRYTKPNQPVPFQVRMVIFDTEGKQQASKDWTFAATGPGADASLDLEPGPDHSILVLHISESDLPGLPEGNQVQILSADMKLRQNFYLPSNSILLPISPPGNLLALQQYQHDGGTVVRFFSGHPLKSGAGIQLAAHTETETTAGPGVAAHLICSAPRRCQDLQVIKAGGSAWSHREDHDRTPHPRAFLSPTALLVEVEVPDKANKLVMLHADGSQTELPQLKSTDSVGSVAGVATDGSRFAIDTYGDNNVCSFLDFVCTHHAKSMVVDVSGGKSGKVIFEKTVSADGGRSSLSPDGKRLAVLDRGKVLLFNLP